MYASNAKVTGLGQDLTTTFIALEAVVFAEQSG